MNTIWGFLGLTIFVLSVCFSSCLLLFGVIKMCEIGEAELREKENDKVKERGNKQ